MYWKVASVTPIHNGRDAASPNSFRPISEVYRTMCQNIALYYLNKTMDVILNRSNTDFEEGVLSNLACATYHVLVKKRFCKCYTTYFVIMGFLEGI